MIKCIAIDLDDTLLNSKLIISNENKIAIKKAIDNNIKIILASGRMAQSVRQYSEELDLNLPIIAYNGAIIQESKSKKILFTQPVPQSEALKIIPIFQEKKIHLNAYINDELYMDKLTVEGEEYAKNTGVIPYPIDNLLTFLKDSPHKMLGIGEIKKIDKIQEYLKDKFKGNLDFVRSKQNYLEIVAPGVSKGNALQKIMDLWNIDKSEVMAIGDAPNDISMISWAGVGIAIGNALNLVKSYAKFVVSSNNENGVAEAINKYVFKD
jgi:Cof subfamily protein (haloacid dehalogenase superfamily)